MKKAIYTLLAGLFLALVFPVSVSALPGGLLDGKPLTDIGKRGITTTVMTDNNESTVFQLGLDNIPFHFNLPSITHVTRVVSKAGGSSGPPTIELLDEAGKVLKTFGAGGYVDMDIKAVKSIRIWGKSNWHTHIKEIDVYGTIDAPKPVGLLSKSLAKAVELQWQMTEGEGFIGYEVFRNDVRLNDRPFQGQKYIDSTAQPEVQYKYKVAAVYDFGFTVSDEIIAAAWPEPLLEPRFEADAWNDRLRISWTENGAVNYILSTGSRRLTEGKVTAYTHTGLEKDTEYPYLLEWVDKYGRKGSMVKTFRTTLEKPPPPPEPPASLQARPGYQMVTLTWDRSPRDDIVGYRVYQDGKQLPGQQRGPTVDVRGLENGREYRFYVTSISDTGEESGPSPEARATPRSEPAPGTGIDPGEVQWGFGPGDILTNSGAILLMLSAFVLLGIVVMYIKPLIGLIREAVKPG
ncbi:fibronectin type III domain-containing protein [Paenibacillus melissococcoides]|uniref:Fibronectin type III domain-containing protein n=5 Tax=Paenibacillus TaxID=44249 RepID=A0ABM9GBB2_9BACL|nr:fibronectin type III domain-containing protein [Paenibacillus melissococcoides]CAH8248497.1 fibronectin type III domain-containing protein [Paenibacillus melissococcoides]CAH8722029.1 fibronectin type III domain-containing protein [Paenibacillus melissococcoides]